MRNTAKKYRGSIIACYQSYTPFAKPYSLTYIILRTRQCLIFSTQGVELISVFIQGR